LEISPSLVLISPFLKTIYTQLLSLIFSKFATVFPNKKRVFSENKAEDYLRVKNRTE